MVNELRLRVLSCTGLCGRSRRLSAGAHYKNRFILMLSELNCSCREN